MRKSVLLLTFQLNIRIDIIFILCSFVGTCGHEMLTLPGHRLSSFIWSGFVPELFYLVLFNYNAWIQNLKIQMVAITAIVHTSYTNQIAQ